MSSGSLPLLLFDNKSHLGPCLRPCRHKYILWSSPRTSEHLGEGGAGQGFSPHFADKETFLIQGGRASG